jgi:hypothetical protein
MLKRQNMALKISKDHLQWRGSEAPIAYPIFIRDPAQQRQFLSQASPQRPIDLHLENTVCDKDVHTYLGQTFIQHVPEKIRMITLQDIFTRHGYRIGKLYVENQRIHHWSSTLIGSLFWGLGTLLALCSLWIFLTTPTTAIVTTPPEDTSLPTIPPALLQKLTALPGAIETLHFTHKKGHVRAYIPKENQDAFGAYIRHISEEIPIQWQHQILGKTRDAFIWRGEWTLP